MKAENLRENLSVLKLTTQEIARLLDVTERTVQRWLSGHIEIPGGIARAVEAWLYLECAGLPWRPDGLPLVRLYQAGKVSIVLVSHQSNKVADVVQGVLQRGGPSAPWCVDLRSRVATLGHAWIKFKILPSGSFIPQSFGRSDAPPDLKRDYWLIEDGYACIDAVLQRAEMLRIQHNWSEAAT